MRITIFDRKIPKNDAASVLQRLGDGGWMRKKGIGGSGSRITITSRSMNTTGCDKCASSAGISGTSNKAPQKMSFSLEGGKLWGQTEPNLGRGGFHQSSRTGTPEKGGQASQLFQRCHSPPKIWPPPEPAVRTPKCKKTGEVLSKVQLRREILHVISSSYTFGMNDMCQPS